MGGRSQLFGLKTKVSLFEAANPDKKGNGGSGDINGTINHLARFTPTGTQLGDSIWQDDGITTGLNAAPQAGILSYWESLGNTIATFALSIKDFGGVNDLFSVRDDGNILSNKIRPFTTDGLLSIYDEPENGTIQLGSIGAPGVKVLSFDIYSSNRIRGLPYSFIDFSSGITSLFSRLSILSNGLDNATPSIEFANRDTTLGNFPVGNHIYFEADYFIITTSSLSGENPNSNSAATPNLPGEHLRLRGGLSTGFGQPGSIIFPVGLKDTVNTITYNNLVGIFIIGETVQDTGTLNTGVIQTDAAGVMTINATTGIFQVGDGLLGLTSGAIANVVTFDGNVINGEVDFMYIVPNGISANIGIGTNSFGTDADKVISILNGNTEVSTSIANGIQIYSVDSDDTTATLGLQLEQAVEAIGVFTPTNKIKIKINGALYWMQLDAV